MPVTYDLDVLQPGDIILSNHSGKVSRIVRRWTKSPWSHAMLYVDRTIVHAVGDGVHTINPQREKFEPGEVAVYRLSGLTPLQAAAICEAARARVGTRYTTWEAVLSILLRASKLKALGQNQYCSRLVAQAYHALGINLHSNPDHCFPSDLIAGAGWIRVQNALRPWTPLDEQLRKTRDTLKADQDAVFAFLRPLDWASLLTFHGRVRDANHAWTRAANSGFVDLLASWFLRRSGWLDNERLDEEVNPHRYNSAAFLSGLKTITFSEAARVLQSEWQLLFEMTGRILSALQHFSSLGTARTILLIKNYEYRRLAVMAERAEVLLQVMQSSKVTPPGHPSEPAVSSHLLSVRAILQRRPF